MQSWTSQPRKSRSSCKNMQSIPSIKPKAPENAWQRLQKIVFAFAWKSGPVQAGQWQLRPQNVARLPSLFSFPISARVQIIPACLGENQAGSNMTMLHPAIAPRLAGQGTCSTSSPAAAVVSCPVCAPRRSARRQQSSRAQRSGSVETSSRSESRPAQHLDYLPGVRPSEQEHNAFGRSPAPISDAVPTLNDCCSSPGLQQWLSDQLPLHVQADRQTLRNNRKIISLCILHYLRPGVLF